MTGADFGYGIYFATDWKKSYGYVGATNSMYGTGGPVSSRGLFLLLCDVIMGRSYMTTSTGSWTSPPEDKYDSIAMYPEYTTVRNDEHVIFSPDFQRIRYIVEFDLD